MRSFFSSGVGVAEVKDCQFGLVVLIDVFWACMDLWGWGPLGYRWYQVFFFDSACLKQLSLSSCGMASIGTFSILVFALRGGVCLKTGELETLAE